MEVKIWEQITHVSLQIIGKFMRPSYIGYKSVGYNGERHRGTAKY